MKTNSPCLQHNLIDQFQCLFNQWDESIHSNFDRAHKAVTSVVTFLKNNLKYAASMLLPIFVFAVGAPTLLDMPMDMVFPLGLTLSLGLMEMFTSQPS